MQNNIIKYGLIAGGVIVLIPVVAGLIMGYEPDTFKMGEIIGYSTMILSLLLIFLAVNDYQKTHPDEVVTFGKILLIGLGISAIAGIMFGIYNVVHVLYIDPEFMEKYYSYYVDQIRNSGAPAAEIDQKIAQLESEKDLFMSPTINFFLMFITVFVIGVVVSLVSAFFQRSRVQQAV